MKKNVRRGFTLPEVLVTVTVVAVLAAVVVPAVTQFASKGDGPSTKQDVLTLTNAVTTFTSDVRKYPGNMRELVSAISLGSPGNGLDLDGKQTSFSSSDLNKWKGPYTSAAVDASGYLTTAGYAVKLDTTLSTSLTLSNGWLSTNVLKISGQTPDCPAIVALDASVDGATSPGAEGTSGSVQWTGVCTVASPTGSVVTPTLRLIPAP